MVGASGAVVLISIISVEAALEGHGPFAGRSPNETALALQQFLLLRAAPLYLVAILIEQKWIAEDHLIKSERRYREVIESQTELVCRFLLNGTLSFVNEAFCRAFQRGRATLVGSDFIALLPTTTLEAARAQIEQGVRRAERTEWECEVSRPDGSVGWQHWLCHPVITPGARIEEFQAIGHDITDRKRAEEAERSLTHASRLAVVGEFTAMLAHEINQPLAAILSNAESAEMLLTAADPPLDEIREILSDIRQSDLRASAVILRIRALLGKREICLQPVDLNTTIADVLHFAASDLRGRQILVSNDLALSLPPVSADRVHLQQVLLNLFANAMEAMKDTPVSSRLLAVSTRRDGPDAIEVVVADRGHGIAPDKLSSIFESFVTTKSDGMGLGLSIARSIVRSHRGRIWAENRTDGGAAFHFIVKVAQGEPE
jgi:PAS domain S-box-containing protein